MVKSREILWIPIFFLLKIAFFRWWNSPEKLVAEMPPIAPPHGAPHAGHVGPEPLPSHGGQELGGHRPGDSRGFAQGGTEGDEILEAPDLVGYNIYI